MKIEVTYKVNGAHFAAVCDSIAEAYECVKAIVKHEPAEFPEPEKTLSQYMKYLVNIAAGRTFSADTFILRVTGI